MKGIFSTITATVLLGTLAGVVSSCGQPDDGVKPETTQAVADIGSIARKAGGDYAKVSDADKKKVLDLAGGSEAQAKALVYQMAHPPSEMNAGKGSGQGGTPRR